MRLQSFLIALLALTLAAPATGFAAEERRKPRLTSPEEPTGDEVAPSSPTSSKKKRKHATAVEDDSKPAEDSPPPPPKKKSNFGDDDESASSSSSSSSSSSPAPASKKVSSDEGGGGGEEEPAPRASRRRSSDGEGDEESLRDDDSGRRKKTTRTAEEELEPEVGEEEQLAGNDEPGNGIAAEFAFGGLWMSGATGGATEHFMSGLLISYQIGRAAFAPEFEFMHENLILELGYQASATNTSKGSEAVRVNSATHYLTLDVLFGYPLPPVLFYAKIGPALMIMPVTYDVQGGTTSFTGVKGGLVYGVGVRSNWYFHRFAGFAWRVELVGIRRGYLDDLMFTVGAGVCF
ncbi:MAG: hypothetical protein QM765_03055 [Myxococcales bacterium]